MTDLNIWEMHHGYIGIAAFVAAWLVIFKGRRGMKRDFWAWALGLFAIWMMGDDLYAHWRQGNEPDYLGPVHRLYVWAFGWLHSWIVGLFR